MSTRSTSAAQRATRISCEQERFLCPPACCAACYVAPADSSSLARAYRVNKSASFVHLHVAPANSSSPRRYSQLYLSACAGPDKQWKLSSVADFSKNCGGWSGDDEEGGDEGGDDTNASCPTGEHGPVCTSDKDCSGVTDCVRCASSGYCTSATLTE